MTVAVLTLLLLITATLTLLSTSIPALVESHYVQVFQRESTEVCGYISENTTWTLSGSPYIVVCDVIVEPGVFLRIEPEVVVKFTSGKNLVVYGGLIAQGNPTHKITFTSNSTTPSPGDWGSIRFKGAKGTDFSMSYVLVEYATKGLELLNVATISNSVISNCDIGVEGKLSYANNLTVTDNTGNGLSLSSPLTIKNSNVSSNGGHGITTTATIETIDNCIVLNNTDGVVLYGGHIKNSRITSNRGNGTRILGPTTITNTTISDNGGDGIWTGSSMSVTECYINGNTGSGIKSNYVEGAITIEHSTIYNNTGDGIWTGSGMSITKCNITKNAGNGIAGHLLVNEFTISISDCNISSNFQNGVTVPRNSTSDYITMHVDKSTITNNNISGLSGCGYISRSTVSGNNMSGISGNFTIEYYNVITENKGGGFHGTGRIYWSNIFNNILWGSYDVIADIWPNNITATDNWWGTNDSSLIEERIWHHNDNESLGYVFYEPWLPGPPLEDIYPPDISVPIWARTNPGSPCRYDQDALPGKIRAYEPVRVSVDVTDDESPVPSGVDRVLLFYRVNGGEWWNTTMTLVTMYNETSGNWATIIPGQKGNSTVEFFIKAYDKAGNWNVSSTYSYVVKWLVVGDINGDGKVDMMDIVLVILNFGKKDP